jgi:hypothetical protein
MASYVWDAVLNLAEAGTAGADPQRAQRVLLSGVVAALQVTGRLDLAVPAAGHEHFSPPHRAVGLHLDVPTPGLLSSPLRSSVQVRPTSRRPALRRLLRRYRSTHRNAPQRPRLTAAGSSTCGGYRFSCGTHLAGHRSPLRAQAAQSPWLQTLPGARMRLRTAPAPSTARVLKPLGCLGL